MFLDGADVAVGSFYWRLVSADFESDGEILPPPGGGNESGGRHAVFVKALNEDGSPVENQKVIASWPTGNPITAVDVLTKGPLDDFLRIRGDIDLPDPAADVPLRVNLRQ